MVDGEWLDPREEAAWRGLIRMQARLSNELGRRLAAGSSLSYPDYEVLVAVTDQPEGRLRPFQLADMLGWERSRLSHHVARMVRRGLLDKEACATDRRGSFVVTTELGRSELAFAAPDHVGAVRELFIDRLTRGQLDAVAAIAAAVLDGLEDASG